jgi:hypothetical protein
MYKILERYGAKHGRGSPKVKSQTGQAVGLGTGEVDSDMSDEDVTGDERRRIEVHCIGVLFGTRLMGSGQSKSKVRARSRPRATVTTTSMAAESLRSENGPSAELDPSHRKRGWRTLPHTRHVLVHHLELIHIERLP